VTAVVANQNELTLTPMPATAAHIASGRLRAIALGGLKRIPSMPNVPTIDESGIKGYDTSGWAGFVAPKGTPEAAINRLREAVLMVVKDPAVVTALDRAGAAPWTTTPKEMWDYVKADLDRYALAVKVSGAKVQ
jgi:tripartite-type tricarboxylate transporter receptor subunit TctC